MRKMLTGHTVATGTPPLPHQRLAHPQRHDYTLGPTTHGFTQLITAIRVTMAATTHPKEVIYCGGKDAARPEACSLC